LVRRQWRSSYHLVISSMSDSRAAAFHPLLPRTYRSDTHSAGEDGKIGKEEKRTDLSP
jgi:hypothetical protein